MFLVHQFRPAAFAALTVLGVCVACDSDDDTKETKAASNDEPDSGTVATSDGNDDSSFPSPSTIDTDPDDPAMPNTPTGTPTDSKEPNPSAPGPSEEGGTRDDTTNDDASPSDPQPSAASDAGGSEPSAPTPNTGPDDDPPPRVEVAPSSGCGGDTSPPSGALTIDVDGLERSYIVSLPEDYEPSTPYPLVFAFHGLGASGQLVSRAFYFGIEQQGGKPSIFVYPDGLDDGDGTGWPNTDGRDVAFFDTMLATMENGYCVDTARVFATGHSYGGIMSHNLGCQRGDVLRAIAPVAGAFFGRGQTCTGPIAAWGAHGDPDGTVAYSSGLSAIERVMEANGCDPESSAPVTPTDYCTRYECSAGYPVTWCIHDQDHDWPQFAAESIKAFFDGF